ncbi:MAG: tRNA (guanine(46)-N(7))-methyltransferase TrmB [Cyanobacteriota bacterium]|nr:tRNA (guanine(46)-N(7))-methyltransferase TrmB [Cyanobacteriota bacterium]
MRQHVNPLSRFHQQPRPLPPLTELFEDPALPLHLDIGSARGRCLLALAPLHPERNHLGIEIRHSLVQAAEADRLTAALPNLRFLFANATVSLPGWLGRLSPGRLVLVSLQFPDPWFKSRHHKRRVLRSDLLNALAGAMAPGTQLFLQSDVLTLIQPMVALVEASGCFQRPASDPHPWRPTNPLPVASERERHVEQQGLPVYRVLLERNDTPAPPPSPPEHLAAGGEVEAHP